MCSSQHSGDLPLDQLEAFLYKAFEDIGLGILQPPLDDSAPVLIQDLQANTSELTEICQVLSERSLNAAQLQSLTTLELAILTLEQRVQNFVSLI
ncbi:MAG: hypothetical protein AAF773_08655 [Cyanobacteria bacterium P01_D01_bin.115]